MNHEQAMARVGRALRKERDALALDKHVEAAKWRIIAALRAGEYEPTAMLWPNIPIPTNWASGHNMPGYLPESDVHVSSDWAAARGSLVWDLEAAADQDDYLPDDTTGHAEDYRSAIDDLRKLAEGSEWCDTIAGYAYWLSATDEPAEDSE